MSNQRRQNSPNTAMTTKATAMISQGQRRLPRWEASARSPSPRAARKATTMAANASSARNSRPTAYQTPVFGMEAQGSAGGNAAPFCSNSTDTKSGLRTNAMRPSRGGRLIVMPLACRCAQSA